jgi:hypothetical protein
MTHKCSNYSEWVPLLLPYVKKADSLGWWWEGWKQNKVTKQKIINKGNDRAEKDGTSFSAYDAYQHYDYFILLPLN